MHFVGLYCRITSKESIDIPVHLKYPSPPPFFFDVLLTVHLSIFISVFNQHVSSTCARNM